MKNNNRNISPSVVKKMKWKGHCAIKREVRSLQVQAAKTGKTVPECTGWGRNSSWICRAYDVQPWRPLPISSVPVNTRRKHSELKHSFFSDTAHHLGTFKAVPVGSLERAGKSPSKMGALQPRSTPTALSWLTSTPLHCTLLSKGEERGRPQQGKKLWFQPFGVYLRMRKPCLLIMCDETIRKTLQRRDQDRPTCTHQASPDETRHFQE